jgi:hypothetical protein
MLFAVTIALLSVLKPSCIPQFTECALYKRYHGDPKVHTS